MLERLGRGRPRPPRVGDRSIFPKPVRTAVAVLATAMTLSAAARAGDVEVVDAKAQRENGGWRFDVTLRHDDTGWDHYADAWEVRLADGTVLGTRTLLHPHVDEQPFTRSLSGVKIPDGTAAVEIHARDTVHGWSSSAKTIDIR